MAIYKLLNSDKTVSIASLELADLAAEHAYIDASADQVYLYDADQDGTGKDIYDSYGDTGYKVLQWVSAS